MEDTTYRGSGTAATTRERHRLYLTLIARYIQDHGYPPTVRELATLLGGRSTSTVHHTLRQMESLGLLARRDTPSTTAAARAAVTAVERQTALGAALQTCRSAGAPLNAAALTAALTAAGWCLERLPAPDSRAGAPSPKRGGGERDAAVTSNDRPATSTTHLMN